MITPARRAKAGEQPASDAVGVNCTRGLAIAKASGGDLIACLRREIPLQWRVACSAMSDRPGEVMLSARPDSSGPWDRGHFIGHAIGGTVDGNEANVFLQLRSANRGRYRTMEAYCGKRGEVILNPA
jgi:hypothetical protein